MADAASSLVRETIEGAAPMSAPPRKLALLIIFLTVFIDLLGFGMVLPLLPIYGKQLAQIDGYSPGQVGMIVGLLMSSFSAMQFLFCRSGGTFRSVLAGGRHFIGLADRLFFTRCSASPRCSAA